MDWRDVAPRLVVKQQAIWELAQLASRMESAGLTRDEISKRLNINQRGLSQRITHAASPSPVMVWAGMERVKAGFAKSQEFYLWAARHHVERNPGVNRDHLTIAS